MFITIEEILSLVTGVSFIDGFNPHRILAHLYGGEECSAHLRLYMANPSNQKRVKDHLCQQVPGLTELLGLGTAPAIREALPDFKIHGEEFYITPL